MKPVRYGSRILIMDPNKRVLLLHFRYTRGALAGTEYWGVPGGGIEPGETAEQAAVRELFEETGISRETLTGPVAEGGYPFRLSSGREVWQSDQYFILRLDIPVDIEAGALTQAESESLDAVRWWSRNDIESSTERLVPSNLSRILVQAKIWE